MSPTNPSSPNSGPDSAGPSDFGFQDSRQQAHEIEAKFDRVDELVSLLVDEMISDDQVTELEKILSDDADARGRYVENMALHADLIEHFRPADQKSPSLQSPVLGSLGPDDSGLFLPPVKPADRPE